MVTCNDCIHRCVCPIADGCEYADEQHIRDDCEYFAPTADVVPKSEVERLEYDNKLLYDEGQAWHREIKKQKSMLLDAIDTFRNLCCIEAFVDYEDTRKHYFVSLDDVERIHDEVKKKYTEGKDET